MSKLLAAATASLTAAALSLAIAGCGSAAETDSESAELTSETTAETTAGAGTAQPADDDDPDTLNEFIIEHDIVETPFDPDDIDSPNFDLPFPPGWSEATEIPDWAFGAIVYDEPADEADPPTVSAIGSKLTGDVEVSDILQFAPGLLDELPEFEPRTEPTKRPMGGFEAIQYSGTYVHDGERQFAAEIVVVVPGPDGLYVLQLDGTSVESESQIVLDAMNWIHDNTTISN